MAFQYHSSKGARLFVSNTAISAGGTGTVELDLISAGMSATNEVVKFVTSKTGRLPYREITFGDNTLTFSIEQDFLHQPTGTNSLSLSVLSTGTFSAALYAYVANATAVASTDPCYNFSSLVIQNAPVNLQVEGKSALNYTCPINGPWTEPT